MLVYHFDGSSIRNVTLYYYLGLIPKKYKLGVYYVKIYYATDYHHFAFYGRIYDLGKVKIDEFEKKSIGKPVRKNIILISGDKVVSFDLNIMDKYKKDISIVGKMAVTNVSLILKFFGVECTNVKIYQLFPFRQENLPAIRTDINYLYLDSER
ncbi:MAG: hypothetical protein QXW79_01270 [Thermoplasmata archaeon]